MLENFSYPNFDQQIENLLASTHALITGWADISTLEMTLDLKSLCLKASRLCVMADTDYVLQQQDVIHQRSEENEAWCVTFDALMSQKLAPLVKHVVDGIRQTKTLEGRKSEMMPSEMSQLLPRIAELIEASGEKGESMEVLIADTLNEYSGYFTDILFTLWQKNSYDQYRELHSKKKWGDSLWEKFRRTCELMNDEF